MCASHVQIQLPAGEDLLRNTEMFAIAIGDVLMASGSSNSITVTRQNIGMEYGCTYVCVHVCYSIMLCCIIN